MAKIDWSLMETDWRVGLKTVLQMSNEHGVSRAAIIKHWGKAGVPRDLAAKIQAKAEALVAQSVALETIQGGKVTLVTPVTESAIVEANAMQRAGVTIEQRSDTTDTRHLYRKTLADLRALSDGGDLLEQLGSIMSNPDEAGIDKVGEAYRRAVSLPGRVDMLAKMAATLEKLVVTERRVYGISDLVAPDEPSKVTHITLVALLPLPASPPELRLVSEQ